VVRYCTNQIMPYLLLYWANINLLRILMFLLVLNDLY